MTTARRRDLTSFRELGGVPAHPVPRYLHPATLATLEAALEDLWRSCPWGQAARIVHMGAFVDRPDPDGHDRHAQGRAIDLGQIVWEQGRVRADDPGRSSEGMRRYLAVTAVLEKHFGCVLNYWQPDGQHRSHWHLDDHRAPRWSPQWPSSIRFAQAALTHVHGRPTPIDGVCGPITLGGMCTVADLWGDDAAAWSRFLAATSGAVWPG